ncbi:MAG TPA: hypothetical protein VH300_17075 [Thermoleophilaceae bacterium]|nr:hypothetical protein [Thermoleophilaceae bacterium]
MGTLRLGGFASRSATVEAGGIRWQISRRFWSSVIQATGEAGAPTGEFLGRTIRRGGTLHWGASEFTLRPASTWRERYALAVGDHEFAIFDGKSWGRRPVKVTIADPSGVEPGLLLFAAYVVRVLAENADSAAAGAATASTAATSG